MNAGAFAPPRLFTVSEFHRMAEAGIIREEDRVELVEGEVVTMSPIGPRHAACVRRLTEILRRASGNEAIVSVQDPIRLGDYSEPQPDITVLRPRADFYAKGHPEPDAVLLLVEVGDASVMYDRSTKLPLYARNRISEVWLVNLVENVVEIHTDPVGDGYRRVERLEPPSAIRSRALSGSEIPVSDVLPD